MMSKPPTKLKPIVHRAANALVYDQLREAISSGQYAPGENLSTRVIADQLGVSQMPVREAFQRLVAESAMVKRENRTIGLDVLTPEVFAELTEIRIALEGLAAAKATENTSKKLADGLKNVLEELGAMVGTNNSEMHLTLNRKLHFMIYNNARSQNLVEMIELLWLRVGPMLRHNTLRAETVIRSNACHERMVAAVIAGDAQAARTAVVQDLTDAAEVVQKCLASAPVDPKK